PGLRLPRPRPAALMAAIQIAAGTSATIQETFYSGGVTTDLDTGVPAVTVTRPDGTTIASGTVSHVGAAGSGVYQVVLAALGVPSSLSGWTLRPSGVLEATSAYGWGSPPVWGRANVVVEYVHGWDPPPPEVASAAMARTAMLLLPSPPGSTSSSWTTPDGATY